jgi:hypothetical protein
VLRDEELRGTARLSSDRFDLNEWRSDDELQAIVVPANLDFVLTANVRQLVFGDLDLRDARGAVRIRDGRATLDDFELRLFGGTMAVNGFYQTTDPARPTFDVTLAVSDIDVAQAAAGVLTVRTLAPAARYAHGRISTDLRLSGALGEDMTPLYEVLAGRGSFRTASLSLQGFPGLERLAETLKIEQLRNPTMVDLRSTFQILDGRLHISPFDVRLGQFATTISGSHGIDETMDYSLAVRLPRALLGAEANQVVATLASQAGRVGVDLAAGDVVSVGVLLGGTVARPTPTTNLRDAATGAVQDVGDALRGEVERRLAVAGQRADSAADEARRRAEMEAARILEEAERQAARLRAEAASIASALRQEGHDRADALVAQATTPAARLAARTGADRLRREADSGALRILREADERAEALLADARRRATAGGAPPPPVPPGDTLPAARYR